MLNAQAIQLMNEALWLVLILSAPPIIVASVVGVVVAIVQSATQLQEQTLQYTLKFLAIIATIFLTAALLGGSLYRFGDRVFTEFPALVRR
jgi:type III secretion protein S